MLLFHFVLPFLLLLSREANRDPQTLTLAAVLLVVMRFVDICWLVLPAFSQGRLPHPSAWTSRSRSASAASGSSSTPATWRPGRSCPSNDPGFEEALAHGRE